MRISRDNLRGIAGVCAALSIIGAIYLLKPNVSSSPDFACGAKSLATTEIDISAGESGSQIAQELFDKGVTASYGAFFSVAVGDERSGRIAPGLHQIDKRICAVEALEQLLDAKRIGNLLAINEGAWNSEIQRSLLQIGFTEREISSAFSKVALPEGFSKLEGLLFPAQYSFDSSTSLSAVLTTLIERAAGEMKKAGISTTVGTFSPQELLTMASLIQAEGDLQDFAKISQVIRNRLKIGMPLQFDSTVHYIKGTRGSVFLSRKSTLLNSPYNTYQRYGLPPGPINNPGAAAMYAASHPAKGAWLYFITVAPGDTRFTDSLLEFNQWKVLYKENLRAGKFGSN